MDLSLKSSIMIDTTHSARVIPISSKKPFPLHSNFKE